MHCLRNSKQTTLLLVILFLWANTVFAFEPNKTIPTVSLRNADQKLIRLNEKIGKPMVLMAFNLACVYCDPEIKLLMEEKKNLGEDLQVFLINADVISKKEKVLDKLKKLECDLPILFDKNQDYTEGVAFPYTIIIDSKGIVKEVLTGFSETTKAKILKTIKEIK